MRVSFKFQLDANVCNLQIFRFKTLLLDKLNSDLQKALEQKISVNPVLTAFADTVHEYNIDNAYIQAFMDSMEKDLYFSNYESPDALDQYIYGSANVVGLMCLKVFCKKDEALFQRLKDPAEKLGAAFQKVNFMRDINDDMNNLGRSYFPEITFQAFNHETKIKIEKSIENDFVEAYLGIKQLPGRSKLAVAIAYNYYHGLFQKIKRTSPEKLLSNRIRISNLRKYMVIIKTWIFYKFKQI